MENTETVTVPVHYNPHQLVTYKSINGTDISFPTIKVTELETMLDDVRRYRDKVNSLQSKINQVIDNMSEDYWYNPNTEASTILSDLCEILDHNPVKSVEFTATMRFTGTVEVPLTDLEDFNLEEVLAEAYVDINNGDIVIDNYELYDANEC